MIENRGGGMTADEAQRLLDDARDTGVATESDRRLLVRGLVVIGVAVGCLIVAMRATVGNSAAPQWLQLGGFGVALAGYLAAILAGVIMSRRAKALPRGYTARYTAGMFVAMAIYAGYVIVASGGDDAAWPWVVATAVISVVPPLIAARSISRLALR